MFPLNITKMHKDSYAKCHEYNSTQIPKFSHNIRIINEHSHFVEGPMEYDWHILRPVNPTHMA